MSLAMAASFAVSAGEAELQAGYAEWRAEAKYGCLAVSDGTREAYLVTAPATAARGFAAAVRKRIAAANGCDPDCVFVAGGKVAERLPLAETVKAFDPAAEPDAVEGTLLAAVEAAAKAAKADRRPAELFGGREGFVTPDGYTDDGARTVRFVRAAGDIEIVNSADADGLPTLVLRRAEGPRGATQRRLSVGAIRIWRKTLDLPLRKTETVGIPAGNPVDAERMRLLADKPDTAAVTPQALFIGRAFALVSLPGAPTRELCRRFRRESAFAVTLVGAAAGCGCGYLYDYATWPNESYPSVATCFTQAAIARLAAAVTRGFSAVRRADEGDGALRAVGEMPPKWISGATDAPECPAPVLFREFVLDVPPQKATFTVAVAGWCEVRVNGRRLGEDVLSPVTCQPDRRLSSLTFDATDAVVVGTNVVEVLLGNGWFNTFTLSAWGFPDAPWRSCPKIRGEFTVDGKRLFATDASWRVYDSPIVFNALRNGEWYDARMEGTRSNLRDATEVKYAPWGIVSPATAVPCREGEDFVPTRILKTPDGRDVYDFGANIAGWCEIEVEGACGAKVTLDYDESITPTNTLLGEIAIYVGRQGEPRPIQHDEYTLAGRPGGERWHARFTYHGFRYALVTVVGKATVKSIRARFVHSAFTRAGTLATSDATFTALQAATERSYLSNFVGIPTDCPHREKNGWTGDAQIAMETGLWNYDAKTSYVHFLRMMLDSQRPNGAVACILPCTPKFGFFWGSGPAWDALLFEIPWQIYRFCGDDAPAREAYGAMKRYLAFISEKADEDGLFDYGLKDWCNCDRRPSTGERYTDTAYVYHFNRQLAFWAERFGEKGVARDCTAAAGRIKAAFNRAFYRGEGLYESGSLTALAAPLYFKGLCAEGEERKVADRLVRTLRAGGHRAYVGILGAKWVPRVLSDYGYADDAFRMFVQPAVPGWAHWLESGDGTLREQWTDVGSHNHIMFGDLSAWAYEYAAGIVPVGPGFRKVAFRPHFLEGVDSFSATYRTPQGEIRAGWRRVNGKPVFEHAVPAGIEVVE